MIDGIPLACWLVAFALTFAVVALAARWLDKHK